MHALTSLILLSFGTVLLLLLAAWLTLTAGERATRAERAAQRTVEPLPRPTRTRPDLSNDAVRGARAPRKRAPVDPGPAAPVTEGGVRVRPRADGAGEDAFERFLEPGRRDDF